jgi:hypothetical protein
MQSSRGGFIDSAATLKRVAAGQPGAFGQPTTLIGQLQTAPVASRVWFALGEIRAGRSDKRQEMVASITS